MRRYIFEPLELKDITMFPTAQMKKNMAYMHQRAPDGTISIRDHLMHRSLTADADDIRACFNSGGAGCFANPREYCQILATLLNGGISPVTGSCILQKSTLDDMFTNQLPHLPNLGRKHYAAAKPDLVAPVDEFFPQPPEQPQGWGLTFMITPHPAATGRSANTVHWAGLPNLWWWLDREKGIAGMVCTQIMPSSDLKVGELIGGVEGAVYRYLV